MLLLNLSLQLDQPLLQADQHLLQTLQIKHIFLLCKIQLKHIYMNIQGVNQKNCEYGSGKLIFNIQVKRRVWQKCTQQAS